MFYQKHFLEDAQILPQWCKAIFKRCFKNQLYQEENLRNGGIVKSVENILPKPLSWKGTNFATVGRSHFKRTILWKIVSYASSDHETLCRSSCIACRQKVSRRCVKACDTSYYCSDCKNSCTVYKQRVFLQCEWACESSDFEIEWRNSHTAHNWKASLLNGFTCKSY